MGSGRDMARHVSGFGRWVLGAALLLYLGIHLTKDQHPLGRAVDVILYAVMGTALVLWVLWAEPVRRRRWTLHGGWRSGRLAIELAPPKLSGNRRLRRKTMQLVEEMHQAAQTANAVAETRKGWHSAVEEMRREPESESETWSNFQERVVELTEDERRALAKRFGGRVSELLWEFRRREMLTKEEADELLGMSAIGHWLPETASKLEGLARQL